MYICIDANGMMHRIWHTLPERALDEGPIGLMAYRLIKDCMTAVAIIDREERPKFSKVLMFWDHEDARATRQALYEGYKAKRDKEKRDKDPDRANLYMTMTSIKRALMSVHPRMMIQVEGMETDDVVAAFADLNEPMVIVTRDKDFYQLLSSTCKIYNPWEQDWFTEDRFWDKYEFAVHWWPFWKALVGDSSDCWPGMPQFGIKSMEKLIKEVGPMADPQEIYPVLKQRFGDVLDLGLGLVTIPFMAADMDAIYRTLQYAIETEAQSNWEGFADTFAIQAIPLPQIEQSLV